MKRLLLRLPGFIVGTLGVVMLAACVTEFKVAVNNHRPEKIVIGVAQYHAVKFNDVRPDAFEPQLLINQQLLTLGPGESRTLVFNDAAGGYWLQWRLLEPLSEPSILNTVDLIRDAKIINVN